MLLQNLHVMSSVQSRKRNCDAKLVNYVEWSCFAPNKEKYRADEVAVEVAPPVKPKGSKM